MSGGRSRNPQKLMSTRGGVIPKPLARKRKKQSRAVYWQDPTVHQELRRPSRAERWYGSVINLFRQESR